MAESTYAIIESGGKQYRAEKGATLLVERISGDEGDKVTLRPVMYSGGKEVVASGSDLEKVKVEASITEQVRGPKIRVFTYKAKKGSRKRKGHRQDLTKLEVTDVKMLTRKAAAKSTDKGEAKPAAKSAAKKPAAKASTAKKPAAKATAKKPAAKASTAKKPAAKKAPAKKTATKKESE